MARVIRLNLETATNAVRAARTNLKQGRDAAILCISSIAGHAAIGDPAGYAAAKAALNTFVTTMARPLAADGIRIAAISPGNIYVDGGTWARRQQENPARVTAMLESKVPLKRFGRPEEIADLACFLVSPRAAFITGTVIIADGGQLAG
jgi:3-oxoacyl-[acyl-carrier protein] reductase